MRELVVRPPLGTIEIRVADDARIEIFYRIAVLAAASLPRLIDADQRGVFDESGNRGGMPAVPAPERRNPSSGLVRVIESRSDCLTTKPKVPICDNALDDADTCLALDEFPIDGLEPRRAGIGCNAVTGAHGSAASFPVRFSWSAMGLTSTTSIELTWPVAASSSMARCASR